MAKRAAPKTAQSGNPIITKPAPIELHEECVHAGWMKIATDGPTEDVLSTSLAAQLAELELAAAGMEAVASVLKRQMQAKELDANAKDDALRQALTPYDEEGLHSAAIVLARRIYHTLNSTRERMERRQRRAQEATS